MESNLPVPDPTLLTTEQLRRELASLRAEVWVRFDGMDKAAELLNENVTRFPTEIDKQIGHMKELNAEKFASVQKQFDERDVRASASESAANTAVNAALQAQKEAAGAQNESNAQAIAKSEKTTEKQFDGINALLNTTANSVNDKIATLSARQDRTEGSSTGIAGRQSSILAFAGLAVAAAAVLFSMFRTQPTPQIVVSPPTSISAPAPEK